MNKSRVDPVAIIIANIGELVGLTGRGRSLDHGIGESVCRHNVSKPIDVPTNVPTGSRATRCYAGRTCAICCVSIGARPLILWGFVRLWRPDKGLCAPWMASRRGFEQARIQWLVRRYGEMCR